jgi:hypothetical protein
MIDQIFGLLLIGLGLQTPKIPQGLVKGDSTEAQVVEEKPVVPKRKDMPTQTKARRNESRWSC